MKKIIGLNLFGFLVLFLFLSVQNAQAKELYKIEKLTPEIVRVIGLNEDYHGRYSGYGDAFAAAIKETEKKYEIENITAINYYIGFGSYTKELFIKVRKKSKGI